MLHGNNRMDIGGHRFFSKDERIMRWWQNILPIQGAPAKDDLLLDRPCKLEPNGPDPELEDEVMLIRKRVSRIYYEGKLFDYPPHLDARTLRTIGLAAAAKVASSYLSSCVHKLPEDSLENFYVNRFGRKLYQMFFEGYTEKVWGCHPRSLSADWGAQRVKGLSAATVLANAAKKALPGDHGTDETSLIEEFWYPKFGPGQLWERVARLVTDAGGSVELNQNVVGIETSGDKATAVVCADGRRIEADAFLSSMPLSQLIPAIGCNDPQITEIAAGLPYRDFVTVGLLVERLALGNDTDTPTLGDAVPDCWIYIQDRSVHLGRMQVFNNWSPYMVDKPEQTVWLGLEYFCQEGDLIWELDEDVMVEFARMELEQIGMLTPETPVLFSCRERMRKAYPAYFGTYDRMPELRSYLEGFDNLYCIGRNGQHRYNNMDHSMLTALAAIDALEGLAPKAAIWNVNVESEYHEER